MPTQQITPPPTSSEQALLAASNVVDADNVVFFKVAAKKAKPDSLNTFETGTLLEDAGSFVDALLEDPTWEGASGQPDLWLPQLSQSSTSTLVSNDKEFAYGVVHLVGCMQNRWEFEYSSPPPSDEPPSTLGKYTPYKITVTYHPSKMVWLISEEVDLTDQAAAPECTK